MTDPEPSAERHPLLLIVTGAPGSGKSHLSRHLAAVLGLLYVSTDHIADELFPRDRSSAAFLAARDAIYRAVYAIAEANLRLGASALVDAPHTRQAADPAWHARLSELATRARARVVVVRCSCSEATLRERIRRRGKPEDRDKLEGWEAFLEEYRDAPVLPFPHVDVDTDLGVAANVAMVGRYVAGLAGAR